MTWTFAKCLGHFLNYLDIYKCQGHSTSWTFSKCPHLLIPVTTIRETNGTRLPGQAQSQTSPPVLFPKGSGS